MPIAHITGGGIPGNLNRVLHPASSTPWSTATRGRRPGSSARSSASAASATHEMAKVFNMGVGMVVVVPDGDVHTTLDILRTAGHRATQIGVDRARRRSGAVQPDGRRSPS